MTKKVTTFLVLCLTILASGCPHNAPKLDLSNNNHRNLLVSQLKENVFGKQWVEYNCTNAGYYNSGINSTAFEKFACGEVAKNDDRAKQIRNEVLDNGLGLIDSVFVVYIGDIRKNRSVGEFIADVIQLGGSSTSGFVHGERVVHILGIFLTGFSGVRKSASLNFYDEKTTSVLIKRMDASRSQVLREIKQSQSKTTAEYSFDAALDDVIRYFDAGTLNRAFTELDKQTSIEAEIARLGVLKVKGIDSLDRTFTPELYDQVVSITNEFRLIEADLKNPDKKEIVTARLKTIYKMITDEPKFNDIRKTLEEKATVPGKDPDEIYGSRLKAVFEKINKPDAKNPLTGRDYYEVVSGVVGEAGEAAKNGELLKLLQNIFAKTK